MKGSVPLSSLPFILPSHELKSGSLTSVFLALEFDVRKEYNKQLSKHLDHRLDDLVPPNELGGQTTSVVEPPPLSTSSRGPPTAAAGPGPGGKKKGFKLEEVTRWTMVYVFLPPFPPPTHSPFLE